MYIYVQFTYMYICILVGGTKITRITSSTNSSAEVIHSYWSCFSNKTTISYYIITVLKQIHTYTEITYM